MKPLELRDSFLPAAQEYCPVGVVHVVSLVENLGESLDHRKYTRLCFGFVAEQKAPAAQRAY
jgi:hypothetical protein